MSGRGLGILIGVLALLVAVAVWVLREAPEPEAPVVTLLAPEIRPEIIGITLAGTEGACHLARQGTGWRITSPLTFEADPREVAGLLNRLTRLELSATAALEGADGDPFGLQGEGPWLELILENGAAVRIAIGDASPVGPERYVRTGDGPVHLAPAEIASLLERDCATFAETRFLPVEAHRIARVDVKTPEEVRNAMVARDGEGWIVQVPDARLPASPSRTDRWLRALVAWTGDPPSPGSGEPESFELDVWVEVQLDDGTYFLLEGAHERDGLRVRRGALVGTLGAEARRLLDEAATEVCERRLAFFSRDDAAEVVLAGPTGRAVLTRRGSRWSRDPDQVVELLDRLGRLTGMECWFSRDIEETEAVWAVELKRANGESLGRFHFDGAGGAGTSWRGGGHPVEAETQEAILNGIRALQESAS